MPKVSKPKRAVGRRGGRKPRPPAERPLTARELVFCDEYAACLNATKAAKKAGFSAKTASQIGYQLLHKTTVINRIQENALSRARALEVSEDTICRELARIGFSDPRNAFEDSGSLKPFSEIGSDVAATISGFKVTELFEGQGDDRARIGCTKEVRFWNKVAALELLGKKLRLFVERVEVSDPEGLVKRMWEGRRRAGFKSS